MGGSTAPAILIPARRASTRLSDKLLLAQTGSPLIVHTCRQAALAYGPQAVLVAADDPALVNAVTQAGFRAVLTRVDHTSGTDRIAEAAARLDAEIIVNVQGDEPELDPAQIRLVAELLHRHAWAGMATLCTPGDATHQANPNNVKVALSGERALTFTRAPHPWDRDAGTPAATCHRHLGIYAYRRTVLMGYNSLPASRLEQLEKLEQLRAIEAGIGIACAVVPHAAVGVDTPADYAAFVARWRAAQASPSSSSPAPTSKAP